MPAPLIVTLLAILSLAAAVPAAAVPATAAPTTAPLAPVPCGPYCGEGAPPVEPALFAPGWVNHGPRTRDIAMAPDGRELLFGLAVGGTRYVTVATTRQGPDGCWSEPVLLPFATDPRYRVLEPHVTPDGRRLYFASDRSDAAGAPPRDEDLFVAERVADGWSAPRRLPAPVNTDRPEFFPSTTRDGVLYFTHRHPETGREVIARCRPSAGGGWSAPEILPPAVNAAPDQFNAWIDPDERFLLVCLAGHPQNLGQVDYWVVFRDPDDTWHGPVNLGPRINGPGREGWSASVSPDGRALFFMTARPATTATDSAAPSGTVAPSAAAGVGDPAPMSFRGLLAAHARPGNGLGHMWWVDAGFLWDLDPRGGAGGGGD